MPRASGGVTTSHNKSSGPGDEGADHPIDVNTDGVAEFTPVEASPGTFTYEGGEITFH